MSEFRIRPKSDYLHRATLEELYSLDEHWKSDMDYYKDEIKFLQDLTAKYYLWLEEEPEAEDLNKLIQSLRELNQTQEDLSAQVLKDMNEIEQLGENPFAYNEQGLRDERVQLEEDITNFIYDLRIVKKSIFEATERVLSHEKLQHLLPAGSK